MTPRRARPAPGATRASGSLAARGHMPPHRSAPAASLAFVVAALLTPSLPAAAQTGDELADVPSGSGYLSRAGERRLLGGGGSGGGKGVSSQADGDDKIDLGMLVKFIESLNLSDRQREDLQDKIEKLPGQGKGKSKTWMYAREFQVSVSGVIETMLVNRPVLVGAACVWVAVNTVGQVEPYYEVTKRYSAYLTFLSAVVVLNIFYCQAGHKWWMHDNPVWSSLSFVFLGVVLRHVFKQRRWCADLSHPYREPGSSDQTDPLAPVTPKPPSNSFKVTNRYQEVSFSFVRLMFLFFVQIMLLTFYAIEIHENADVHDKGEVSYFKWFLGVCIVFSVGGDEMGSGFNPEFWDKLEEPENERFQMLSSHHLRGLLSHKTEWRMRKWMSFLINSAGKWYILSTFPIVLSIGDEYEFIMDCMATWFITSLDDLPGEKDLRQDLMAELREEEEAGAANSSDARQILAELSEDEEEAGQDPAQAGELRERHPQRGEDGSE